MAPEYLPYTTGRFTSMPRSPNPRQSEHPLTLLLAPKCPRGNQALAVPFIQMYINTLVIFKPLGRFTALGNQASTLGLKKFWFWGVRFTGAKDTPLEASLHTYPKNENHSPKPKNS